MTQVTKENRHNTTIFSSSATQHHRGRYCEWVHGGQKEDRSHFIDRNSSTIMYGDVWERKWRFTFLQRIIPFKFKHPFTSSSQRGRSVVECKHSPHCRGSCPLISVQHVITHEQGGKERAWTRRRGGETEKETEGGTKSRVH